MMRDTFRAGGLTLLLAAMGIVLVILVAAMAVFGFGIFQRSTAEFRGKTAAIERLKADPDYRISVYDRFFSLCSAVKSAEDQIDNLEAELEGGVSPERKTQIQGAITALRNSRAENVNDYNAAATADFTAGAFLDLDLPFQLSVEQEETTCAAS